MQAPIQSCPSVETCPPPLQGRSNMPPVLYAQVCPDEVSDLRSVVARLGNSWMPLTFYASLRALQQPHKHSQLFTLNQNIAMYIQCALCALSAFFPPSPRGFLQSTVGPHQSTEMALDKATSHIIVTHPSCFFWLPPWENVNRSTTLIYSM